MLQALSLRFDPVITPGADGNPELTARITILVKRPVYTSPTPGAPVTLREWVVEETHIPCTPAAIAKAVEGWHNAAGQFDRFRELVESA